MKDHVIAAQDAFPTTPVARWDANIRALRIVKDLEAANRMATPEEQKALAQYSGFGDSAFEQAFSPRGARDQAWVRRHEDLKGLVSAEEFAGIEESRLTAFYTTPGIVKSMWETVSAMGADKLENPRVLEPSAGSGRFLGLQPPQLAAKSSRVAVELDPLTADITKHLYPETRVYKSGFEAAPLPNDHFDIAISNVPFGDINVYDKEFNATGRKYLTNSIHNYFFAKTLDKLRPGGVMAYISSHNLMDSKGDQVRRYLADRADLLGAVRLPDDAFPDTEVVTDVIYLRKRAAGEGPGDDSWVESEPIQIKDIYSYRPDTVWVNRYFVDNPDRVLGKHSNEGSMYRGSSYTVKSTPDKPVTQTLAREAAEIARSGGITPRSAVVAAPPATVAAQPAVRRSPKYVVVDGALRVEQDGKTSAPEIPTKDVERVRDLVGLRDTARRLVNQESQETPPDVVDASRASLRGQYDAYVAAYGEAVNTPANRKLLGNDADDHLLFALEVYDKETECWRAADIMHRRVVGAVPAQKVGTATDALSVVQNETGTLDFDRMGALLGRSAAEVREELADAELIYKSPSSDAWIPAAEYLSGNVREKLKSPNLPPWSRPSLPLLRSRLSCFPALLRRSTESPRRSRSVRSPRERPRPPS